MSDISMCRESFLDDIVKVELFPSSECSIPIPFGVALTEIIGATFNVPAISVDLSGDKDAQAQEAPTLKITNGRSLSGHIYTHDLQVAVNGGYAAANDVVRKLQGVDFHIVYTLADETRWLSYSLPNTSLCDIDDTHAATRACMLKVKLQSMSNLIALK